jgi:hypothetical protein
MRRTSISHLYTEREGPVLVLRAIDPYGDDVGWHPAKTDDGWAALESEYGRYAPHFGGGSARTSRAARAPLQLEAAVQCRRVDHRSSGCAYCERGLRDNVKS